MPPSTADEEAVVVRASADPSPELQVCALQVGADIVPPGTAEMEDVVLRASASAVTFQGFLAAYASQHFRRRASAGASADPDEAGDEDAAGGDSGAEDEDANEELSATLMRLAVRWICPACGRC